MTHKELQLFRLFDTYARANHNCFVSERFWSLELGKFLICFRPVAAIRKTDKCHYLHLDAATVDCIIATNAVPANLSHLLDQELRFLISDHS